MAFIASIENKQAKILDAVGELLDSAPIESANVLVAYAEQHVNDFDALELENANLSVAVDYCYQTAKAKFIALVHNMINFWGARNRDELALRLYQVLDRYRSKYLGFNGNGWQWKDLDS